MDGDRLWLPLPDVTRASGWDLKPGGMCRDEVCVPMSHGRRAELLREEPTGSFLELTGFARLIQQPFAHDDAHSLWYFGPAGWDWKSRNVAYEAPDFMLPDLEGLSHSFSELRGKKVFLLFWASW